MKLIHEKKAFEKSLIKTLANMVVVGKNAKPILAGDLIAAYANIDRITKKTKWAVEIWQSIIILTEADVMIGTHNPKTGKVQRADIARTEGNIENITKAQTINDLLIIFGRKND